MHNPISRHRLPQPYRFALTVLWLTPQLIFFFTLLLHHGLHPALFDPRLLLPLLVMGVPALYVWREGVDVFEHGLLTRIHVPRFHAYHALEAWRLDRRDQTLTIWDTHQRTIIEARTAHLTDADTLIDALDSHLQRH